MPDVAVGEFWHGTRRFSWATAMVRSRQAQRLPYAQLSSGYLGVSDFNGDGVPGLAVPSQDGTVPILLPQIAQTAPRSAIGCPIHRTLAMGGMYTTHQPRSRCWCLR